MSEMIGPKPEPPEIKEFRDYLEAEFKVTNLKEQYLVTQLFSLSAIQSVRQIGLLPYWKPMEAVRHRLAAEEAGEPDRQTAILLRLYKELEDSKAA